LVIKIKFIGEREGEKGEEEMSISVSIWVWDSKNTYLSAYSILRSAWMRRRMTKVKVIFISSHSHIYIGPPCSRTYLSRTKVHPLPREERKKEKTSAQLLLIQSLIFSSRLPTRNLCSERDQPQLYYSHHLKLEIQLSIPHSPSPAFINWTRGPRAIDRLWDGIPIGHSSWSSRRKSADPRQDFSMAF
jgi:hypothetical protein